MRLCFSLMASISLPCPKCAVVPRILKAVPCLVGSVGFSAPCPARDGRRLPVLKAQVKELSADSSLNSTMNHKKAEEDVFKNDIPKEPTSKEPVSEAAISAFMDEATRLIMLVDTSDVSELQLKHDDFELVIRKKEALAQPTPPPPAPVHYPPYFPPQYAMPPPPAPATTDPVASAPSAPPAAAGLPALPAPSGGAKSSLPPLKSPMAGTFYRSPAPNTPPFVKEGDKVKKGQTVCIIEAMKLMNEIEADKDGTVLEILIEDGKPVGFGKPILIIQP